ncbi:MAG: FAD/NAD(P)-binding protein [Acidimicrobiales bacterium]
MTLSGLDAGRDTNPLGPMTPAMYRVVSAVDENAETVTLELEPTDRTIEPPRPGQFNMLWSFGIGEVPISLGHLDGHRLLHTIRRVGAVTQALCAAGVGDLVGVRGPFGNGWPLDRAEGRDVLIVAGGLGLAPVRPLIEQLVARSDQRRRVVVLVGARTPEGVLYNELLDEWRSTAGTDVEVTVDAAPASWRGHVGLVTQLMERAAVQHSETILFTCGPEVMMRFAATTFTELGGSTERTFISVERNMHCGIGHCGHCQLGPALLCRDGPVMDWATAAPLLSVRER